MRGGHRRRCLLTFPAILSISCGPEFDGGGGIVPSRQSPFGLSFLLPEPHNGNQGPPSSQ